jgi:hypothetical protein
VLHCQTVTLRAGLTVHRRQEKGSAGVQEPLGARHVEVVSLRLVDAGQDHVKVVMHRRVPASQAVGMAGRHM